MDLIVDFLREFLVFSLSMIMLSWMVIGLFLVIEKERRLPKLIWIPVIIISVILGPFSWRILKRLFNYFAKKS